MLRLGTNQFRLLFKLKRIFAKPTIKVLIKNDIYMEFQIAILLTSIQIQE